MRSAPPVAAPERPRASASPPSSAPRPPVAVAARPNPYVVRTRFDDFDASSLAPPEGGFEMVLTGPESGTWRATVGRFSRSAVTFGVDGGPNVGHARVPDGMVVLRVSLSGIAPICAGHPLDRTGMVAYGPGAHIFEAIRGRSAWVNLAVDPGLVEVIGSELGHRGPLVVEGESRVLAVSAPEMAEIRALLVRIRRVIRHTPSLLAVPEMSAALERDLVRAFVAALATSSPTAPPGATERRRARVLLAAMEYLGATRAHAVTLRELCRGIGTSPRTLTRVFHDAFRLPPARYLKLRRMGQVRAHLRRGMPRPESVTSAAMQFGFTELGRFAVEYRRLFGERPSETLRSRRET